MKRAVFYLYILACMTVLSGCDLRESNQTQNSNNSSSDNQLSSPNLSKVSNIFIQENQIMSERDALSREISYYRAPSLVRSELLGYLDGKNLIHIANSIQKEDSEAPMTSFMGSSPMKIIHNVDDVKTYGLDHPNDVKAELYVFGGDFVNYGGSITRVWKLGVYIPETSRYLEVNGSHIAGQPIYSFTAEGHEWISKLPIFENVNL